LGWNFGTLHAADGTIKLSVLTGSMRARMGDFQPINFDGMSKCSAVILDF